MPYIRLIPKVTAVAGEEFRIKCPVAGYPIEEIRWERGKVSDFLFDINFIFGCDFKFLHKINPYPKLLLNALKQYIIKTEILKRRVRIQDMF